MLIFILVAAGIALLLLSRFLASSPRALLGSYFGNSDANELAVAFNMSIDRIANGLESGWPISQAAAELRVARTLKLLHGQKVGEPLTRYEIWQWQGKLEQAAIINSCLYRNERLERLSIFRLKIGTNLSAHDLGRIRKWLKYCNKWIQSPQV